MPLKINLIPDVRGPPFQLKFGAGAVCAGANHKRGEHNNNGVSGSEFNAKSLWVRWPLQPSKSRRSHDRYGAEMCFPVQYHNHLATDTTYIHTLTAF